MHFLHRFASAYKTPFTGAELRRSQFQAFLTQVPLLYFILATNSIALAITHLETAPAWLALWTPLALCVFVLVRVTIWLRRRRVFVPDDLVTRKLRTTMVLVVVLAAAFTTWGLALYPYGSDYARVHVAFYIAVTVIGCIFCLMHMRAAALLCTLVVNVPFVIFFSSTGNPVLIAIAVNVLLVSCAMVMILLRYYGDFASLVKSRSDLLVVQAATQKLSDDNRRLANQDSLADLPNRRSFFADLEMLLRRPDAGTRAFAIGVIDLDGFKQVNDLYGHSMGDRVIEETGRRLAMFQHAGVKLARLGGDEFGLLVLAPENTDAVMALAAAICEQLQLPYVCDGMTARLSASIGLTRLKMSHMQASQLYDQADYALYFAKENRRGGAVMFSQEHETRIRRDSQIKQALKSPTLAQELTLAYQPILHVATGRVLAFEALARWHHPVLGHVSPADFIEIAERSNTIHDVTEMLLRQALADASAWPQEYRLSFNLSACDVSSEDAMSRVARVVRESGFAPERIDFEITETAVIRDFEQARMALTTLKGIGACISLDDFGTGYSSLNSLHRLPLDKVKIDRSFVMGVEEDRAAQAILRAIFEFCDSLQLTCVAEGVETESQAAALCNIGCSVMQGYLFSRPIRQPEVLSFASRFAMANWAGIPISSNGRQALALPPPAAA